MHERQQQQQEQRFGDRTTAVPFVAPFPQKQQQHIEALGSTSNSGIVGSSSTGRSSSSSTLTNSALQRIPSTMPAAKAPQLTCERSLGADMNRFNSKSLSFSISEEKRLAGICWHKYNTDAHVPKNPASMETDPPRIGHVVIMLPPPGATGQQQQHQLLLRVPCCIYECTSVNLASSDELHSNERLPTEFPPFLNCSRLILLPSSVRLCPLPYNLDRPSLISTYTPTRYLAL